MSVLERIDLVVGGDLCPIGRVSPNLERGDAESVFGSLMKDLKEADLVLANLECPLVAKATPAIKGGPVLEASVRCLAGLKQANLGLLGLANNHIMDHGPAGLASTTAACHAAGIATVGAGVDLSEAGRLWVKRLGGLQVGVMAVAEAEYSIAGRRSPGANPMDPIRTARMLQQERGKYDFLIALVHGGNEHLAIPRPGLRDYCRWLIEEGVRVVLCQHSHCLGTFEEYQQGLAVYGQGNFLFDSPSRYSSWSEGVLVKLSIASDGKFNYEFVPYQLKPGGDGIERLAGTAADRVLGAFRKRSMVFESNDTYEQQWRQFCEARRWSYVSLIHGFSRPLHLLNHTGLLTRSLYTKRQLRNIGNVIRCESHREVMTTLAELELETENRALQRKQ